MKHLIFALCTFMTLTMSPLAAIAQSTSSGQHTRSEQFIIDSLQLEVERAPYIAQTTMYADSLQQTLEMQEILSESNNDNVTMLLPISFFLMIIIIVAINCGIGYNNKKNRYRIIEKAIENGQKLPEGLFDEPKKNKKSWVGTVKHGIIWSCLGCALWLFGTSIEEETLSAIGIIPALIGIGYIISAIIEFYAMKSVEKDKSKTIQEEDETLGHNSLRQ